MEIFPNLISPRDLCLCTRYYCGIYCLLSTIHVVLNLAACLTFIAHGARASKNIHGDCLHNLLQAPLSWFESVPSGRILSRFSADLAIMDVQFSFYGDGKIMIGLLHLMPCVFSWIRLLIGCVRFQMSHSFLSSI